LLKHRGKRTEPGPEGAPGERHETETGAASPRKSKFVHGSHPGLVDEMRKRSLGKKLQRGVGGFWARERDEKMTQHRGMPRRRRKLNDQRTKKTFTREKKQRGNQRRGVRNKTKQTVGRKVKKKGVGDGGRWKTNHKEKKNLNQAYEK